MSPFGCLGADLHQVLRPEALHVAQGLVAQSKEIGRLVGGQGGGGARNRWCVGLGYLYLLVRFLYIYFVYPVFSLKKHSINRKYVINLIDNLEIVGKHMHSCVYANNASRFHLVIDSDNKKSEHGDRP